MVTYVLLHVTVERTHLGR